jgi:type II secretory pathway pseudopilin PulG
MYYLVGGAIAVVVIALGVGIQSVLSYIATKEVRDARDTLNQIISEAKAYRSDMLAGIPRGAIIAWDGAETLPAGWAICDGQNGTPDLRKKFVMGTGEKSDVGKPGGSETHSHPAKIAGTSRFEATNQGSRGTGAFRSDGMRIEVDAVTVLPPYVTLIYIMKIASSDPSPGGAPTAAQ